MREPRGNQVAPSASRMSDTMQVKVHSEEWKRMLINLFGFQQEWLYYYGDHVTFENLYNQKRFGDMMKELSHNDDKKRFLLHHVYIYGKEHWNAYSSSKPFKKAVDDHIVTFESTSNW